MDRSLSRLARGIFQPTEFPAESGKWASWGQERVITAGMGWAGQMSMVTSQTGMETRLRCLTHSLPPPSTLIPPFPVESMDCPIGHCRVLERANPTQQQPNHLCVIHSIGCTALEDIFQSQNPLQPVPTMCSFQSEVRKATGKGQSACVPLLSLWALDAGICCDKPS